jgi:outer membrane protein assembly factor BamB/tetratricopeptide (TPR) repeat protein
MGKTRRLYMAVGAGCALLAALTLLLTSSAEGQVKVEIKGGPVVIQGPGGFPGMPGGPGTTPPGGGTAAHFSAIKLVEKSEYRQYIDVAREAIRDKAWNDVVTALQLILDNKEDYYVRVKDRDKRTGREVERWTSVKYEANNLLGSMPEEGLDFYEVRVGAKARQLLDESKKKGNFEQVAEVAQKYLHTKVGAEANDLLATYFLDRGQFFMAALRYERLLALNPKRVQVPDLTLFKAAFAYRRAGDVKSAERLWGLLYERIKGEGGLKISGKFVAIDKLENALEKIPRPEVANPHDWALVRGNVTNSAQANGSPPLLDDVLWRWTTLPEKNEITNEPDERDIHNKVRTRLDTVLNNRNANQPNAPIMPGFFPIAVGGKMIFRTYFGISAYLLSDLKEPDGEVHKAGEFYYKTTDFDGSLAVVLTETKDNLSATAANWAQMYQNQPGFADLLYENSMVGTLSTDHRFVYAVDDLAVPPPPQLINQMQLQPFQQPGFGIPQGILKYVYGNTLRAFNLHTGSMVWDLGIGAKKANDNKDIELKESFRESLFLGPPLPVGGKLYVLNEKKNGDLQLVTLTPIKENGNDSVAIGPVQALGTVDQHALAWRDLSRRTNAVHLGYGEGILVCPTHAGEILGVDLMSRTLAWAYPYREKSLTPEQPNPFVPRPIPGPIPVPTMNIGTGNWYNTPPVIVDGKVVFTAPDASSIHCINLRDGTLSWKRPQMDGDLYLGGVFGGKVVIVGKTGVRLRRLSDGEQLKFLPTGDVPSGQGVASKNVYYLPLKKGEICAIDLARETIKAHNRASSGKSAMPGNLVFYEGAVLSQTPLEVVAYPQLTHKLEVASAEVAKDPNDLTKRTLRGELRLADGQVQGAIDDLRTVRDKNPPADLVPRVRQKLYLALTDLFQADFNEASAKYLKEYEELCNVPGNADEEQQRRAHFLRLVGQGREAQGNLVEAFQAYKDFGALPIHRDGQVALPEDPTHKVPTNVWLRGRIAAMIAKATPQQRLPLEEKIAAEWQAVRAKNDVNAIRNFAAMFDVPFSVGREARLQLAESIIDTKDKSAFLEAELSLEQLRSGAMRDDPQIGGRALEALARLEKRKGTAESMKLAAVYLRQLGQDFGKAVLRDGKTGADLYGELTADKRFLPDLEQGRTLWASAKIEARELSTDPTKNRIQPGFALRPTGDLTPMTRQHRLVLEIGQPRLHLVDMMTNKDRWEQALPQVASNQQFFGLVLQQAMNNANYFPNARFRQYQVKGHLAVVQVGTQAFGLDLENPEKVILWQQSLLEGGEPQGVQQPHQMQPDQDGDLQMIFWNNQGIPGAQPRRVRVGHIAAVEASYVCLLRHRSLLVLDPLRGTTLWTKSDLPEGTAIFGDDQHLYLVEGGGAGRALRASDGAPVEVPEFAAVYQNRLRLVGRKILAATPGQGGLTLRLYDIPTGKDVWSKTFDGKAVVLQSEDPTLTGVVEPSGKVIVVDARTGEGVLEGNALQGRVTQDDLKDLREPLLLADQDHIYVALNRTLDNSRAINGTLASNFSNGLHCAMVNGWVLAFQRHDGELATKDEPLRWKKGDLDWHSCEPMYSQMIILEQFETLPILLFSARYVEPVKGQPGNQRWVSVTQSIDKRSGKMIYDPINPRQGNGQPTFHTFSIDLKAGTLELIGQTMTVLHYVDDGRKRPELESRLLPPGHDAMPGVGYNVPPGGIGVPPGVGVRPIIRPRPIIRVPRQVVPPVETK